MPNKKSKKRINQVFFKRLICFGFIFVFLLGGLVLPLEEVVAQVPPTGPSTVLAPAALSTTSITSIKVESSGGIKATQEVTIQNKQADDKSWIREQWDAFLNAQWKLSLVTAIDNLVQSLAQKTVTYLASARKGEAELSWGDAYDTYIEKSLDSAAGNFIEGVATSWGDFAGELCKPSASMRLKFGLGLFELEKPREPQCTFSEMLNNWDEAVNDPDFLKNFSVSFGPAQNDVSVWLGLLAKKEEKKEKEKEAALYSRGTDSFAGIRSLDEKISGDILTPAAWFKSDIDSAVNNVKTSDQEQLKTLASSPGGKWEITKLIGWRTLKTLGKSIGNEVLQEIYKGLNGTYSLDDIDWEDLKDKLNNPLTDSNAQDISGGKQAAEAKYSKFVKTNLLESGNYDVLSELESCDNSREIPGPTNCVLDGNFAQAIREKLTVQEALEGKNGKKGFLDGDKAVGYGLGGEEISYLKGYPYRSLVILRKYRIIPVGWELAAEYFVNYGGGSQPPTLNMLIDAYNDMSSPYYHLVDPNWVLKLPSGYCKARGFGPEFLSKKDDISKGLDSNKDGDWDDPEDTLPKKIITRNDQYCADEQSCIKEGVDGNCEYYGYCMEEKRLWKFDGDACDEINNTCQAFVSPDGEVASYLKNSLDWDGCSKDNSGCQWYCNDFNPAENSLTSEGAVAYWSMDELTSGGLKVEDEVGSNDGSLKGDTHLATGKWGKALSFDGVGDYVEVPGNNNLDITREITLEAWINTNNVTINNQMIVGKYPSLGNERYMLRFDAATGKPQITLYFTDGAIVSASGSNALSNNQWYHIVGTYDNSDLKIYVNGIEMGSTPALGKNIISAPNDNVWIGKDPSFNFNGSIDEVAIYNRALSGDEIWNNYVSYNCLTNNDEIYLSDSATACEAEDAGCNEYLVPEDGLVGYWKFDKGEGAVAYDASGNENNGTLINNRIIRTAESGSATLLVDTDLFRPSGFWDGWNIIIDSTTDGLAPEGEIATIITTAASNTFTLVFNRPLSANIGTGDTYILYRSEDGPIWTDGHSGQALSFDGVDDYVDCGNDDSLNLTTAVTVSAWIKPNPNISGQQAQKIVGKFVPSGSDPWELISMDEYYDLGNRNVRFIISDGSLSANGGWKEATTTTVISDNQWWNIVGTWDKASQKIKIYVNGVFENDTDTDFSSIGTNNENFLIGKYVLNLENVTHNFDGLIDDVAIYNRALNDQEISNLYNNGINFSDKYVKAPNKNLKCFGRTASDAIFDLPSYADNCIALGSRFDSYGYDTCFEFLSYTTPDDCEANNGVWSTLPIRIPRHTDPSYCRNSGGVWIAATSQCQTQCLKLDDAVCSDYVFSCKESELGCEEYTPTQGGTPVPGVISDDDLCPSECAGYDTYKQESTNFETPKFLVNFIPSTARACPSNDSGCDEFTNLEPADGGGESLEYWKYLRQCEKIPTESAGYQCGDFYTWVGSDATGYQLQSYYLKSIGSGSTEEPMEILRVEENLGDCNDANDALTNKNCKEFYNSEGVISYHLLKKTITCSDECINYRKTTPSEFDLAQVCKNIGGTWVAPNCGILNSEEACKAVGGAWTGTCNPANITDNVFCEDENYLNGIWDAVSLSCSKTNYQAIPSEGTACQPSSNGCRQYTGNVGSNVMNVFNDNFESDSYIYDFPNAGRGWSNGSLSSESTDSDQKSFKVDSGGNQSITKWLSAKCSLTANCTKDSGCDCLETETLNDGVDDDEVVCKVLIDNDSCMAANYTYNKGTYLLSFWAKGNNQNNITVNITYGTNSQLFGNVTLSDQWQEFTLGPLEFDVEGWGNYQLSLEGIKSDGGTSDSALGAFFDNVKLEAISDSVYVIKDSWRTPASCDRDWQGNSYLYYMLGCDEYSDTQSVLHYLKSFTNLCRSDAVGCQQLIDTHNFSDPFGQTWNIGDKSEITIPGYNFVYFARTQDYSCMQSSAGCAELGQPIFNQDQTIVKGFDTVYKINDPDYYDASLCLEKNVGCKTFISATGDYYFKDPGEKVCEYIQPTYEQDYGWYKKSDSYDINSEKCPTSNYQNLGIDFPSGVCIGGVENGRECLSGRDNQLEDICISGGGSCGAGLCSGGTQNNKSCLSKCSAGGGYCGNWTGACVPSQSGCNAFVDPISDSSVSLITNGLFNRDLDGNSIPDNWKNVGGGLLGTFSPPNQEYVDAIYVDGGASVFSQDPIDIKPNTTYTVSADIKQYLASNDDALVQIECLNYADGFRSCPSDKDKGFYFIDEAGELASSSTALACSIKLDDRARLVVAGNKLSSTDFNRYSMRFFSGTCNKVQLSVGGISTPPVTLTGQSFDNVSLRETGVYYYIDSSLDEAKRECNGYVNSDNGCVLLNNRNSASLSTLNFTNYLNYNADKLSSTATSCVGTDGSKFGCNADTLMKVRPDRDCNKWLYCTDSKIIDDEEICSSVGICDKMNKNGGCISNPLEYSKVLASSNMTFDAASIDKIKNLSGYSKVGFDWSGGKKVDGNLPPSQMAVSGLGANLSNGDFELANRSAGYSRKPIGWDVYECSIPPGATCTVPTEAVDCLNPGEKCNDGICDVACVSDLSCPVGSGQVCGDDGFCRGAACDFDIDCPDGEICKGNIWEISDFGLVNNPIEQQKIGIEPVSGDNILRLTSGSEKGRGHALFEDVYVNPNTKYILSGYINTRNLSYSGNERVYGTIRVLENNSTIAEERIESGSDGWAYIQSVFTTNSVAGKIKIKLTDAVDFGEYCEGCDGEVYFDDISISPVIAINEDSLAGDDYTPMSCRLFPESESTSCEYENQDGYKYKGWYGYCLEHDPVYPEYCLNWYPVDEISGGSGQSGDSYGGKVPLYYCLEAKAGLVYPAVWYPAFDTVGPYNVFWRTADHNYSEKSLVGTYRTNYIKEVIPGGNYGGCSITRNDAAQLDIRFSDHWDSGAHGKSCNLRDLDTGEVVFSWAGQVDYELYITFTPMMKWYCSKIIKVVSDSGQNKYWARRLSNGSIYEVEGLGYSYKDDDAPFGSMVPPDPQSIPEGWDSNGALAGKQPIFTDPSNTIRATNPYSCAEAEPEPDPPLIDVDNDGDHPDGNPCGYNDSDEKWLLEPTLMTDFVSSDAVERIKRLFAKSYGAWEWVGDLNNGQYVSTGPAGPSWDPPVQPGDRCVDDERLDWDPSDNDPNDYCGIPPKVENLKINGQSSDEKVLVVGSGNVSFKFNSKVDIQQLPLTSYTIEWGDKYGDTSGESGSSLVDKPNVSDPHSFSHEYRYTTLYANKDDANLNILCGSKCSDNAICKSLANSDASFCAVRPTVEITDNWGWVNDIEEDGVGLDDGLGSYIYVLSSF